MDQLGPSTQSHPRVARELYKLDIPVNIQYLHQRSSQENSVAQANGTASSRGQLYGRFRKFQVLNLPTQGYHRSLSLPTSTRGLLFARLLVRILHGCGDGVDRSESAVATEGIEVTSWHIRIAVGGCCINSIRLVVSSIDNDWRLST